MSGTTSLAAEREAGGAVSTTSAELARLRRKPWYRHPRTTRLYGMVAGGALLALATGPQASTDDIYYSVDTSMTGPRLPICIAIMVALWALLEFLGLEAVVERRRSMKAAIGEVAAGGGEYAADRAKVPVRGGSPKQRAAACGAWLREQARWVWKLARTGRLPVVAAGRTQAGWRVTRGYVQGNVWLKRGLGLAAVVFLAVLPLMLTTYWNQVLVDQVAIYVLLAIGLNVVVGWAGLLDLGFIAFFAIGAYTTAFWTGSLPTKPPFELNSFLVIPIAIATCLLAGLLLGAPTLRLRGDYLAIVTLGFHEIIVLIATNANGFTGGSGGVSGIPNPSIDLGFWSYHWQLDPKPYWWLIMVLAGIVIFLFLRLEHSKVGRAWTAIREDEIAAAANGVNTVKYKLMAFAIGASTSGLAGVVYVSKTGSMTPKSFEVLFSVLVLAYVVFGGMGSIWGVIVGTAFLAWLPQYLKEWVPKDDRITYLGALLVLMMVYRPQGLIPSKRRKRELTLAREGLGDADAMTEPAGGRIA